MTGCYYLISPMAFVGFELMTLCVLSKRSIYFLIDFMFSHNLSFKSFVVNNFLILN